MVTMKVTNRCPSCDGPVTYQQSFMYVRDGRADDATGLIHESDRFQKAERLLSSTAAYCDNKCNGGAGYLGCPPATAWAAS